MSYAVAESAPAPQGVIVNSFGDGPVNVTLVCQGAVYAAAYDVPLFLDEVGLHYLAEYVPPDDRSLLDIRPLPGSITDTFGRGLGTYGAQLAVRAVLFEDNSVGGPAQTEPAVIQVAHNDHMERVVEQAAAVRIHSWRPPQDSLTREYDRSSSQLRTKHEFLFRPWNWVARLVLMDQVKLEANQNIVARYSHLLQDQSVDDLLAM